MKNNLDDNKFREFLTAEKKEALVNPWFVKKVLNRLPERDNPYQWIIRAFSVVAIIIAIAVWPMLCESAIMEFDISAVTFQSAITILAPVLVGIAVIGLLVYHVYMAFRN